MHFCFVELTSYRWKGMNLDCSFTTPCGAMYSVHVGNVCSSVLISLCPDTTLIDQNLRKEERNISSYSLAVILHCVLCFHPLYEVRKWTLLWYWPTLQHALSWCFSSCNPYGISLSICKGKLVLVFN